MALKGQAVALVVLVACFQQFVESRLLHQLGPKDFEQLEFAVETLPSVTELLCADHSFEHHHNSERRAGSSD
jgi:hypothetical protein